jgi:hypothetical protein
MDEFTETSNAIAGAVPCDPSTVRDYCDWGLLEHRRLANGIRLLKPSAVERVREIRTERLARRGKRAATA